LVELACQAPDLVQKVRLLWGIEGLVFSFFEQAGAQACTLVDLELPPPAGPPAHCGLAMAAVQMKGFRSDQLYPWLASHADQKFVRFSFETVGLMLAVYEQDLFGRFIALLGRLGVIRRRALCSPRSLEQVTATMTEEQQLLAAHGYGRALYFKRLSLRTAITEAVEEPCLRSGSVIRGLISGYLLVNCHELERTLDIRGIDGEEAIEEEIQGGLTNTLALLEWCFPRCLQERRQRSDRARDLIAHSVSLAKAAHSQGQGPPMEA
jgi:hypothetical protein